MIGDLPWNVTFRILMLADYKTVLTLECVSKKWHDIVSRDGHFWEQKFEADFGDLEGDLASKQDYNLEFKVRFHEPRVTDLVGHSKIVICVCISGTKMVSGSFDGVVRIWDLTTMECEYAFYVDCSAHCTALDGGKVVAGNHFGYLSVWDLDSKQLAHVWKAHDLVVEDVQIMNDVLISWSIDNFIKMWDMSTYECLRALEVQDLTCIHVEADEIICGVAPNLVHALTHTGELLYKLQANDLVACVRANKRQILAGCRGGNVEVWNRKQKEHVGTLRVGEYVVRSFQCDALKMICSSDLGDVSVWDLRSMKCKRTSEERAGTMWCLDYSKGKIVVGFESGWIKVLDFDT